MIWIEPGDLAEIFSRFLVIKIVKRFQASAPNSSMLDDSVSGAAASLACPKARVDSAGWLLSKQEQIFHETYSSKKLKLTRVGFTQDAKGARRKEVVDGRVSGLNSSGLPFRLCTLCVFA